MGNINNSLTWHRMTQENKTVGQTSAKYLFYFYFFYKLSTHLYCIIFKLATQTRDNTSV